MPDLREVTQENILFRRKKKGHFQEITFSSSLPACTVRII